MPHGLCRTSPPASVEGPLRTVRQCALVRGRGPGAFRLACVVHAWLRVQVLSWSGPWSVLSPLAFLSFPILTVARCLSIQSVLYADLAVRSTWAPVTSLQFSGSGHTPRGSAQDRYTS